MFKQSARGIRPLAALLSAAAWSLFAGTTLANECWLDIFDQPDYRGAHLRIEGPVELGTLRNVQGQNWTSRIESLKVGPDAEVLAYRKENFEDDPEGRINHPHAFRNWGEQEIPAYQELEIAFGPGKSHHHLGELNFHHNISSLKIRCRR